MKGQDIVLRALSLADPEHRCQLTLVGSGPDRERLESLASRLRVPTTIQAPVQYDEVPACLRSADAFVFATRQDVWGFALQEAAATGLPMIASVEAGATRELVVDGVTGWAVLPEPHSVSIAVRRLLGMPPAEVMAMRAAARSAAERLSVHAAVEGFREAIRQALDRRASEAAV